MGKRHAVFVLVNTSTVFEELFRLARHLLAEGIEPIFHFTFGHWNVERDIERCRNAGIQVVRDDFLRGSPMSSALARARDFLRGVEWRLMRFPAQVLIETIDLWLSGARADEFLSVTDAQLLVLSCDLVGYDSAAYVKAAHRQGKKALIVSSIMSNGLDVAEVYLHNPRFHINGSLHRVIASLFPKWMLSWRGRRLFRVPPHRILAMELLGLAPPTPWLFNSSRADAVTMESEAMADYCAAAGMAREQMRVVGSTADDVLAETLANREALRNELCRSLGLPVDCPIILTALPPDFLYVEGGRPECDFRDYKSLVEFWIRSLSAVRGHSVVISMHPSTKADDMRALERYGARISTLTTPELVPLCDFFVASISSTIRWAVACGIPVLNYDVYRYRYVDDFGKLDGVLTVEDQGDFLAGLNEFAESRERLREMQARQRAVSKRWGYLDGECGQRLVGVVFNLLATSADSRRSVATPAPLANLAGRFCAILVNSAVSILGNTNKRKIMIKGFLKRLVNLGRRAIGIRMLEGRIVDAEARLMSRLEALTGGQGQTGSHLEERYRTLAGLAVPMILSQEVSQKDILEFCKLLSPFEVEGFKKIRMGNKHDGGYIFVDDLANVSTVISCGISNDVTFDLACAEMGKPVVQFDHTVEGPPVQHPNFKFRKQAIDAVGTIPGSVRLWEVVKQEGDPAKIDLLLKIDIEGEEWSTFANFPIDQLKRFRQITCEFHSFSRLLDPEYFYLCLRALSNIHAGFFTAHLHANNFRGYANLMGVPVPDVLEATFVNRDLYRPAGHQRGSPTSLDNPNDESRPDMVLSSPFQIS